MSDKQRVLIVDDDLRNQRIAIECFDDTVDYKVASSGEEALATAESFLPDLILLDIMMPGIDGYEVCKRIRSNPKFELVKVILVSGKAMLDERLKGYEVGADDYMTKPFIPEELTAKARVFLRLVSAEKKLVETNRDLDQKVVERTHQLVETQAKMITNAKMSALGEMAGGIAHEINTPLATIGLLSEQISELAGDENPDKEMIAKMAATTRTTVGRISKIINGLRMFSRDGSKDPMTPTALQQIMQETLVLCGEKLKKESVQIDVSKVPENLILSCQPVQISQVLLNLIGNACDAVRGCPERWVRVSAERTDSGVQIAVTDSGPGIPQDIREKVFQPFFTTKGVGSGTGLGLSVSKGIIEAHGGTLRLDDSSKNTKFIIDIPSKAEFQTTQKAAS